MTIAGVSGEYGKGGNGGLGGSSSAANPGPANTGQGGEGTWVSGSPGANGGSGLVAVQYQGDAAGTGGTVNTSGGVTTHLFTTVGSASSLNLSGLNLNTRLGAVQTGVISSSGNLSFSGPGTLSLNAANTHTGTTRAVAGTLNFADVDAVAASTLDMNAADAGSVGFTLSNQTYNVGGLQGSRDLAVGNNNSLSIGANNASTTYSGAMSGSGGLTKVGTGTMNLTGANAYIGGTTVSAGTLLVNGSLSNSAVTVGNGGTLGGSGALGALVTVQSGGVLSPGNSPGALAAAALDLQFGSTTLMQVIGSGSAAGFAGTDYDQIRITTSGGLTYGGSLNLNFGNSSQLLFLNGTVFDLFAFTGSPIDHFSSVVSSGTGLYANLNFSRTGGIWTSTIGGQLLSFSELTGRLSISGSAVPEIDPAMGANALSLIAGVLAMIEQRRRRAALVA